MPSLGNANFFRGFHDGEYMLLVGAAPSLNQVDLGRFAGIASMGANRILQHETFTPTYLVLCDRTPYVPEVESGRLHGYAQSDGIILASETIWDPSIKSRGIPAQPKPTFDHYTWRVGTCSTPFNWTDLQKPLCSFGTIIGPMIQMAVVFGAKKIGLVGVDLCAPPAAKSIHFYENEVAGEGLRAPGVFRGPNGRIGSQLTLELLADAKVALKRLGVAIYNLSPVLDSPMSGVFGNAPIEEFLA